MKTIKELRGYEHRAGDLHLFAVYEDGSYSEIDPGEVTSILNDWFERHAQLKIGDIAPQKKRKAG